ncbi:hypothetical protein AX14_005034 [Amanita brunnescens Koide BX004]|nr:hypothetical protein AX14_005034 [Amanita brunnescens Koide BX004]
MSPADFRGPLFMDDLLFRLQDMNISSESSAFPQYSASDAPSLTLSNDPSTRSLDGPFSISMSFRYPSKASDPDFPTVIDTFAPKPFAHDLSPPSSASSERGSTSPPYTSNQKTALDAFNATRSRVVRLSNLPLMAQSFLSAVFLPQNHPTLGNVPTPVSLWTLKDSGPTVDCVYVWAVFKTHEEARAVLSLSGPAMSVTAALESDLEPYHKLQAFKLRQTGDLSHVAEPQVPTPSNLHHSSLPSTQPSSQLIPPHVNRQLTLRAPSSYPDLRVVGQLTDETMPTPKHDYTISSNPPNPRSNFRIGDWICSSPKCAAHNFGRNLVCIGCGCPRTNNSVTPLQYPILNQPGVRTVLSPRFVSQTGYSPQPSPGYPYPNSPSCATPSPRTPLGTLQKPSQPLLTPSGRAFAIGGRVRNISNDPLSPCIMYWPDNEALPEQGQIRPGGLTGLNHPPILNTGNRGPISHQPGDWICKKCNYLNWRRRKVCQTCLPYAEGNGDSISAPIQAERIALLTSVLAQTQLSDGNTGNASPLPVIRSHSSTPPNTRHPRRPTDTSGLLPNSVHRSHSQLELTAQYTSHINSLPIYQTSGHRQPSPLYSTGPEFNQGHQVHAPAPLLPSFLQDMVQSPTLSPSSSSSADLSSLEEDTNLVQDVPGEKRQGASPVNIWRLGIEESKSYNVFALQNRQNIVTAPRNSNVPMLR